MDSPITPEPAAISPDDKDWTWVLREVCPECGFDASKVPAADTGALTRANVESWTRLLTADTDRVRARTDVGRWSTLEYACHVRDVFRIYDERLGLMLTEDGPRYANWDQDQTAVEQRYDLSDPVVVAGELRTAGEQLAAAFDAVSGDQWDRTGYRGDGAEFTVDTFARYFIHDPIHHLWDVTGS